MSKPDCFDLPQEAANHKVSCRSATRPHYIMVTPAAHYTFLTDFLPRCVDDVELKAAVFCRSARVKAAARDVELGTCAAASMSGLSNGRVSPFKRKRAF